MEDKKIKLEDAARQVFYDRGYKKTNISEITKKAEVSVGSFYNYYQSKEEIFLDVHIKENNKIRNEIMHQINWNAAPLEIIKQLFYYSFAATKNNKIISEWNNPAISGLLRQYYSSDKGKANYPFHQFLTSTFEEKLRQKFAHDEEVRKIMGVYELIYYIDCHVTESKLKGYSEALQTLVEYFVKGIFA